MAAGDIESRRKGSPAEQAIGKVNPGTGINFVISGPVSSSLNQEGESIVDFQNTDFSLDPSLYLVGLGLRKDSGYKDSLLTCREIWIPFLDSENNTHRVVLVIESRTSYPNWIYVWTSIKSDINKIDRSWIPAGFSGEDIYNVYEDGKEDLDYSCVQQGPGGILFIPYIHPNYLTSDDYNGILGNVMETAEYPYLYSVLRGSVDCIPANDLRSWNKLSSNLRYKHYLVDDHKVQAVGGLHAGELIVPGGNLSRVVEQSEYFKSFNARAVEFNSNNQDRLQLQTLDLPYMSYRAISASIYVDPYFTEDVTKATVSRSLEKVWEDLQGGNVDDPEVVYFVKPIERKDFENDVNSWYLTLENRSSVPVTGSILFKVDGHLAVRYTNATVYAPFLNTVYRTGQYGEVLDLFTSESVASE